MLRGKCTGELLQESCYDIEPVEKYKIANWKNNKRICLLRDSSFNFINNIDNKCYTGKTDNDGVEVGYKKCGSGSVTICRKTNDSCPLTDILNKNDARGGSYGTYTDVTIEPGVT